jgi:hypothetical protein
MKFCIWFALGLALIAIVPQADADQGELPMIRGTVTVSPDLADHIAPDDRLIIKLYHPEGGVELDVKYHVVPRFILPFPFLAAPSIDAHARTKYDAYVVEVLTDKDEDAIGIAPGELIARTPGPVPLGTKDVRIELNALRE